MKGMGKGNMHHHRHNDIIRETRERRRPGPGELGEHGANISANCKGGHEIKTECRCVAALQTKKTFQNAASALRSTGAKKLLENSTKSFKSERSLASFSLLSFELAVASF